MAFRDVHAQLREERKKNEKLLEENMKLRAQMEYIAVCDHPEMLEEEEETNE